jgi:hypothetical protein
VQHLRDRCTKPLVGVGDHEADPFEPSLDELAKERGPELVIFGGPGLSSQHRALTLLGDADRDDGGDRDHPARLTDLVERGIEPEIRGPDGEGEARVDASHDEERGPADGRRGCYC